MNILHIAFGYMPAVAWGGPVKIAYEIVKGLHARNHSVAVCASNLFDKKSHIEPGTFTRMVDGVPVHYLSTYVIPQWPGTVGPTMLAPSGIRALRTAVKSADVVHIHDTRNMVCLMGAYQSIWADKPIVLTSHGTLQYIVAFERLKRVYDRLLLDRVLRQVKLVIAGNATERQQIIDFGLDPSIIRTIHNGIDTTPFDHATRRGRFRDRFNIPADEDIVLFMGRINVKKGTDLLTKAFAQLPAATRAKTRLVIAGPDDGQLAEVNAIIAEAGIADRVLFTGLLEGEDTIDALIDATIFALTCRTDTFPMALVEACAANTPILLTETCEIADLLGDVAAKITALDVGAIRDGMHTLLEDKALQAHYREGGAQLVRTELSQSAVTDQLEAVYREALS